MDYNNNETTIWLSVGNYLQWVVIIVIFYTFHSLSHTSHCLSVLDVKPDCEEQFATIINPLNNTQEEFSACKSTINIQQCL